MVVLDKHLIAKIFLLNTTMAQQRLCVHTHTNPTCIHIHTHTYKDNGESHHTEIAT